MAKVSAVWRVVQQWLDQQQFPPNQSKLAQAVGVQRSAVSDWKTGKTRPSPDHLRRLNQLMEPTLGPDTYTLLMLALLSDMGYGESVGNFRERLPRGRFVPADASQQGYAVLEGLPTDEEFDLRRDVQRRGSATELEVARLKEAGLLPRSLKYADVERWLDDQPDPGEDEEDREVYVEQVAVADGPLSEGADRPDDAIAADEQETSIAGESEESDTP